MDLSIIVPAHNEEGSIAQVIKRIEATILVSHELIIVNDHSSDQTAAIVSQLMSGYPNLRLIENPLTGSFANAIRTGLSNVKTDLVVPVMADLCDDLNTINKMHEKIVQGYDVVCGARYISGGARLGGSRLKGFLSAFAGWSLYYLLGIPTHDIANAFKMYRRKVLDSMNIEAKGFEISLEMPLKAFYAGFRITEVPTVWREREKGKSNFKMFKLAPNYLKFYLWGIAKRFDFRINRKNNLN